MSVLTDRMKEFHIGDLYLSESGRGTRRKKKYYVEKYKQGPVQETINRGGTTFDRVVESEQVDEKVDSLINNVIGRYRGVWQDNVNTNQSFKFETSTGIYILDGTGNLLGGEIVGEGSLTRFQMESLIVRMWLRIEVDYNQHSKILSSVGSIRTRNTGIHGTEVLSLISLDAMLKEKEKFVTTDVFPKTDKFVVRGFNVQNKTLKVMFGLAEQRFGLGLPMCVEIDAVVQNITWELYCGYVHQWQDYNWYIRPAITFEEDWRNIEYLVWLQSDHFGKDNRWRYIAARDDDKAEDPVRGAATSLEGAGGTSAETSSNGGVQRTTRRRTRAATSRNRDAPDTTPDEPPTRRRTRAATSRSRGGPETTPDETPTRGAMDQEGSDRRTRSKLAYGVSGGRGGEVQDLSGRETFVKEEVLRLRRTLENHRFAIVLRCAKNYFESKAIEFYYAISAHLTEIMQTPEVGQRLNLPQDHVVSNVQIKTVHVNSEEEYLHVLMEVQDPYVDNEVMKQFERTLRGKQIEELTILRAQSYGRVSYKDIALRLKRNQTLPLLDILKQEVVNKFTSTGDQRTLESLLRDGEIKEANIIDSLQAIFEVCVLSRDRKMFPTPVVHGVKLWLSLIFPMGTILDKLQSTAASKKWYMTEDEYLDGQITKVIHDVPAIYDMLWRSNIIAVPNIMKFGHRTSMLPVVVAPRQ